MVVAAVVGFETERTSAHHAEETSERVTLERVQTTCMAASVLVYKVRAKFSGRVGVRATRACS